LSDFIKQTHEDHIHWVESGSIDFSDVRLKSAPLNIGPYMQQSLFEPHDSVVLTSATLSTGGQEGHEKGGFEFFCGRIGLAQYDSVKLGSPFDYEQQVTVYVESNLPEPSHDTFVEKAADSIKKYLLKTNGRAFVLFTSYRMLEEMAEILEPWLGSEGFTLLQQGGSVDRTTLLHQFKEDEKHVLFGTDSFWQGVDVPGDTLSNVIIVKLPFSVPDHPLLAGRLQQIKKQGGNPFFDYQLPSAIIKFKQGFGRLIRTKTDQGIVVILDSRIVHKRYGRHFLESIPRCRLEVVEE
jgi:ATP-dependent DNA helicase DinG